MKALQKLTKCAQCVVDRELCGGKEGNYNDVPRIHVNHQRDSAIIREGLGFGVQNYSGGTQSLWHFLVGSINTVFCIFQACMSWETSTYRFTSVKSYFQLADVGILASEQ